MRMRRSGCRVAPVAGILGLLFAAPLLSASQAELDQRCEDAREEKLAPLRQAEIDKCKAGKKRDPASCETYYSTFGDATGSVHSGAYKPRMFDDLPECVAAREARDKRSTGTPAGSRDSSVRSSTR